MGKVIRLLLICIGCFFSKISAHELAVAMMFQNEAPYLKEWIEYHKMVGVEHFWLYNDASTDNWQKVLEPYITEGLVEVIDWQSGGYHRYIAAQRFAMRDALRRSSGVTSWLAVIDTDEFLIPMQEKTISECLEKHFKQAAAAYVNWHHFGTNRSYLKQGESLLFKLTACSKKGHPKNGVGKSIVRPNCIAIENTFTVHHFPLLSDCTYYNGDAQSIAQCSMDLKTDGKSHTKFLRLNHYHMRDEQFFRDVRIPRSRGTGIDERLIWEHYYDFNKDQDVEIINFIMKKHPQKYEQIWKGGYFFGQFK